MSDFSIPMNVRPPQFQSGSDLLQRGLSIQNLAQNTQLVATRIQEEKAKLRQAEEDREDEGVIQKQFMDPKYRVADPSTKIPHFDSDAFRNDLQGRVRMRNLQRWDTDHQKAVQATREAVLTDNAISTEKLDRMKRLNDLRAQAAVAIGELSDSDKVPAYVGWRKRLADAGDDVSTLPESIPSDGSFNQTLNSWAAGTAFHGRILNDLKKKQEADRAEQQAKAIQAKTEEDIKQRAREQARRSYASVRTPQDHAKWLGSLDPSVADEYQGLQFDPKTTPNVVRDMALTTQQTEQDAERRAGQENLAHSREESADAKRAALENTKQFQNATLDLKRDIAEQGTALRRELAGNAGVKGKLTGNAFNVEARNISAQEDGTPTRPGLNNLRLKYGNLLTPRKNSKGKPIYGEQGKLNSKGKPIYDNDGNLTDAGEEVKSQLDAATDSLQAVQFRKAKLYGIVPPDPSDVSAVKDGGEIEATDGSIWKKSSGVAFFKSMGTAPATPSADPAAPPAAPKPVATPASAPQATKQPPDVKGAKTFPRSRLAEFAKRNNITPEAAEAELKTQGYIVQ